jgi:hypothetical protein
LFVNPMSNVVGGLMPVPAPNRIFVDGWTNHAADTFGLTDQTTSASRTGGREKAVALEASREMRSTRRPAVTNACSLIVGRASTNRPVTPRSDRQLRVEVGAGHERVV